MQIHIENAHFVLPPSFSAEAMGRMEQLMQELGRTDIASGAVFGEVSQFLPAPPVTPGAYWPGQGGHYVCTLPAQFGLPERHLIVAADEKTEITWGAHGEEIPGATSQVDGRSNTQALAANGGKHPAAAWTSAHEADGHKDFHLPSRFELFMCWLSAPQLFDKSGWYWSSSQFSRSDAWCQGFEYGYSYLSGKANELRARPVRWIHL